MQSIRSVILELQPESVAQVRVRITALEQQQKELETAYSALASALPLLHFMSITVFPDAQYDPVLVIEANFDGAPGPFWQQFERAFGEELRAVLRCGKAPRDGRAALFQAVTRAGSRAPMAQLLEALSVAPIVGHQGNRGLDRARIVADGAAFTAVQAILDRGDVPPGTAPADLHRLLRAQLQAEFGLDRQAPPRIPPAESLADYARLAIFVLLLVVVALLPGTLLGMALLPHRGFGLHLLIGVGVMAALLAGLLAWVRTLEQGDPAQDAPPRDEAALRAMARREDRITQNHMGSIVHIKPGVLRAMLLPVALTVLSLYLRVSARDGYLSSMRTIHFAHWALVSNRSRLMFFSNFDGSWESYLDDFIEKAHTGLTLAWTSGIGFPPTRYLVQDGASQGRKFKAWARHSMAESLFWYSGYKGYTVNQIERQARVADGLRAASLDPGKAAAWAMDL